MTAHGTVPYDPHGGRRGAYSFAALDTSTGLFWLATEYVPPTRSQTPMGAGTGVPGWLRSASAGAGRRLRTVAKVPSATFRRPLKTPSDRRAIVPSMPLPPSLSPEQRQAALEKAAAARRLRAELKEKLKMGSLTLKELLDQSANDEVVAKMKVVSVLESLPGLGKVKARRLMEEIGISETRKVQGLGQQQRRRLLEKLAP